MRSEQSGDLITIQNLQSVLTLSATKMTLRDRTLWVKVQCIVDEQPLGKQSTYHTWVLSVGKRFSSVPEPI